MENFRSHGCNREAESSVICLISFALNFCSKLNNFEVTDVEDISYVTTQSNLLFIPGTTDNSRIINPFLPGGSPKNRQITQKNHNHLSKQQAVATQIPTQFKQKLETIFI